jgi:sugar phosphate isomerase/epimerase
MRLSLVIQTPEVPAPIPVALLSGSLDDKLRKADSLGADGVELMCLDPASLDADQLRAGLKANHLKAAAVASGGLGFAKITLLNADASIRELAWSRLLDLIRFASSLEAPVVTIGSFRGRSDGQLQASLDRLGEILYQAAVEAQRLGVRLAVEPLNRYEADLIQNVAQGLDFLRQVGHPALGLLLDTYHVNIEESSWSRPFAQALVAGKLFHVHLGDNNRLPPGKGLIDFEVILDALHSGGYKGFLSAELLAIPDPDTAASQCLTYIQRLLEKIH